MFTLEETITCDFCYNTGYIEVEIEIDNIITKKCPYHERDETPELD
jgi:hypothetical protein